MSVIVVFLRPLGLRLRIDSGSFGICEVCEEDISEARLKARPVTTLCIDCKMEQEKKERIR